MTTLVQATAHETGTTALVQPTISQKMIDDAVANGRRLRSREISALFAGLGAWVVATAKGAMGRRATVHLGCSDCGDMMRA